MHRDFYKSNNIISPTAVYELKRLKSTQIFYCCIFKLQPHCSRRTTKRFFSFLCVKYLPTAELYKILIIITIYIISHTSHSSCSCLLQPELPSVARIIHDNKYDDMRYFDIARSTQSTMFYNIICMILFPYRCYSMSLYNHIAVVGNHSRVTIISEIAHA